MKISILGTNGFLSTAIARYANRNGWQLDMYGLDEPVHHSYTHFYPINLMEEDFDYQALQDSDIIIYAIGAGIQSNLKEGYNLIYHLNVTTPVRICNKLKKQDYHGVFVTFGSVFEMGETKEEKFFTEEDVLQSVCPAPNDYVVSKRMLTRFITSYKHSYAHWHFIIPTIYGAGENPLRLIPYTINAIRKGEHLSFTSGEQVRQYVHVSEIANILDLAIQRHLPSGVYNIEGKDTLTVKEIVALIHKSLGVVFSNDCFGSAQRADVGMKYLALDGTKLRGLLGFEATISISDVISTY